MAIPYSEFCAEVLRLFNQWIEEERATLKPGESKVLRGVQIGWSQPADLLIEHGKTGYVVMPVRTPFRQAETDTQRALDCEHRNCEQHEPGLGYRCKECGWYT